MEDKKLRAVQMEQLSIMDKIHKFCVKHSIKYYLIGGSALGAVRHKGFIPWDVDIDIAMTRENYRNFSKLIKSDPIEDLEYFDYKSLKLYNPPHAIIIKRNTELFRDDRAYNKRFRPMGIFVDILPLDNAPDSKLLRNIQAEILRYLARFKYYKIASYFPENKKIKKIIRYISAGIFSIIPMRLLNYVQQKTMMAFTSNGTKCFCSMSSHYSYRKQCMPKDIYGDPTLIKFEDKYFYAPNKLDEYLTRIYGNYMIQPNISEQNIQRSYFYDANFNSRTCIK